MGWIPWKYWNIVELPGKAGRSLEQLELLGKHTDAFLEDLLAFYA